MTQEERANALRANVAAYDNFNEAEYVNGAPHLKHDSIGRIYRSLIASAVNHIDRDPASIEVLELGAGNGLATFPWFQRHVRLTAIDSSEVMLVDLLAKAEKYELK